MHQLGFTHIVSVLAENEDPYAIRDACTQCGLGWTWVSLGTTKSLPQQGKPSIASAIDDLLTQLNSGCSVYLHCSAGIHRTGMITAALLFRSGEDAASVRSLLAHLRPVTEHGIGEARLDWAASFANAPARPNGDQRAVMPRPTPGKG